MRVRRLMRVSTSGNVLGPRPSSVTHSSGAAVGAHSRPAKADRWQAAQNSAIGSGLRIRAARVGIASAPTRPSAENSASMVPPNAGLAPASTSSLGSQVNMA